tara:strand:+ start:603 stop:1103 length:501 start_codon:yes stop_codon:yes gene_type:complete
MKTIFAFTFCVFAFGAFAQEEIVVSKEPSDDQKFQFNVVEKIPVIKGCGSLSTTDQEQQKECMQYNIVKHVGDNFEFPENARMRGIQAKIYIGFVIERDGSISNVEIYKGAESAYKDAKKKKRAAAKELDKEAIRVIKLLEFLEPAYQKGKPVRMSFTMPINAKLS